MTTYFDIIPKDICRYNLPYIQPEDLRSISHVNVFRSIYQDPKNLEQYLRHRGLLAHINYPNEGLWWASEIGAKYWVNYFIEKGATFFDWAMVRAAGGGHRDLVELMIKKGATDFDWAMREAAKGGHREIAKYLRDVKERRGL